MCYLLLLWSWHIKSQINDTDGTLALESSQGGGDSQQKDA